MGPRDFKDSDALAFESREAQGERHNPLYIGKRKRTSRGLEIVFDQDQHREYVTGFHKRKVERRRKAEQQKAEKDRKQRLEDKAERRAKLREELDLERYETPSEDGRGEAEPGGGRGIKVYKSSGAVTTVTVAPLLLNSDDEREAPGNASGSENELGQDNSHLQEVESVEDTLRKEGPKQVAKQHKRCQAKGKSGKVKKRGKLKKQK